MHAKRWWLACAAGCLFWLGQLQAASDRPAVQFELKAQPLMEALFEWSKQSGVKLSWRPDAAASQRMAPRVSGRLLPEQALSQLLAGSGLTFRFSKNRVRIQSMSAAAATAEDSKGPGTHTEIAGAAIAEGDESTSGIIDEVHVTGTNIQGVAPAGSQITTVNVDDFRRSGYATLGEIFEMIPQNVRSGPYGESADARLSAGSGASGNVTYGAGANLRSLGAAASLVLINGRRIVRSTRGFIADVSMIPLQAISRIEILLEGASAIYGADAVAGVVNIILKREFNDWESRLRYGFTQPTGRREVQASQALGAEWKGGGILAVASYLDQTELSVDERPSTQHVMRPASIFPANRHIGVLLASQQELSDVLSLQTDLLYGRATRRALGSAATGRLEFPVEIDRLDTSMALKSRVTDRWDVVLGGNFSREGTDFSFLHYPTGSFAPAVDSSEVQKLVQQLWTMAVSANGRLASVPGGEVGLAGGAEHREEHYAHRLLSPAVTRQDAGRSVNSLYVEVYVPIVAEANAIRGVSAMSVSLAARYDEYSDFGGITNPKLGFSWSVVSGLEARATYSHSFRPAATGSELLSSLRGTNSQVQIYSFTTAARDATIPVAFLTGSHELRPERARHWTAGLVVRPTNMEGLQFGATYYDISYYDRIVRPPLDEGSLSNPSLLSFLHHYPSAERLQAALATEIPRNLTYADRTGPQFEGGAFGPTPQDAATTLFDARLVNAGLVRTSGIDCTMNYSHAFDIGRGMFSLNANYIRKIETAFGPGAPSFDSVGITGNPARLRVRATAVLTRGPWEAALAANFTSGYTDTGAAADTPVDSHTTIDANLTYSFPSSDTSILDGLSLSLSVDNMLNEAPPYVSGALSRGANYDATNANPLGRFIAIEIAKAW